MHQQTIIVLLISLAVSTYGLDLSHAAKLSINPNPNVASLDAKILAAISQNSIPASDAHISQLSEEQLRGFFSGLWNDALKPPLENAISTVSLLAAQVLAGVAANGVNLGIGKRDLSEAEMRGFLDALNQAVNDVFSNVIQKPLEDALAGGALMLAQVLAGVGVNGINLGGLLGKRDLSEGEMRGFLDALNQAVNDVFSNVIQKPLEDALAGGALMLAQVLAGVGVNGINLGGLLGKRDLSEAEMRGFFDALNQAVNDVFSNVIQKPLEDALAGGALMLAQVLAGVGVNGVNLGGLLGKRDLSEAEMRGFLDALNQAVNDVFSNVIQKPLEDALAGGALMLAQVLAGVGVNGINLGGLLGKRDLSEAEMRGFFDALNQAVNDVFSNVIQKPLEDALAGGALMLAQVLAGVGVNGINLGGLLGKRDLTEEEMRGIFSTVTGAVVNGVAGVWNNIFQVPLENFVQNGALTAAGWLANIGTNGANLGKRSAEVRGPIFDNLFGHATGLLQDQVKPLVENALSAAAIHLAGVLANFSQSGIGRR